MATGMFVKSGELSRQADELVTKVSKSGDTCFITKDGRAKAVLMDIQHYNALMDIVEEAELPSENDHSDTAKQLSVKSILKKKPRKASRK